MADVFISYKREDRPFVKDLARALQQRGFTVWWDSRLETGTNWMACIKRALDSASTVVVVWTPKSVGPDGIYLSETVASEADNARRRNILLPVRIQGAQRPFPHDQRNEEDLSNWQGNIDDPGFARLAGSISTFVGEKAPPEREEIAAWLEAEAANNADAYRAFRVQFPRSRFNGEVEPRAAEIENKAADLNLSIQAAQRITASFAREVGKPNFVAPVDFNKIEGREQQPSAFDRTTLFNRLKEGGRFVLSAVPGGGKTVALLDWAHAYCDLQKECVGVFLRLKEFAKNGNDLFEHLERLEGNGIISAGAWKALASSGVLTLFCDGWNELNEADRERVGTCVDIYARSYPSSGMVIGTRPIAPPPFSGKQTLLSLQRLTFGQVTAIVQDRLGAAAAQAVAELKQLHDLRDLVKTPFFLTAFCETRLAGVNPTTREGLVSGLMDAFERPPQHNQPIRAVFHGQQSKYLTALAVGMLSAQQADLDEGTAMRIVNETSDALFAARILAPAPVAANVLHTLRDHHSLIEAGHNLVSYRFQHQLIEEWYASIEVRRVAILALTDDAARQRLDTDILNDREWTEAVIFAVEATNHNRESARSIAHLVLRSIGIEPDFGAALIAVAPPDVWQMVLPAVRNFVDAWQRTDKRRVIRFVMQCGREEFSSIVWDAIYAEKSGRVPDALEDYLFPHPSVLGPKWQEKYALLKPDQRADLAGMLVSSRRPEGAAMALSAVSQDKDPKVLKDVAEDLDFHGFDEELHQLLEIASPEAWDQLVHHRVSDVIWEEPWRQRALEAAQRVLLLLPAGEQRIGFALEMQPNGLNIEFDIVTELLECKVEAHQYAGGLYKKVAALEGERLSQALVDKILSGQRVIYEAADFIIPDIEIDQEKLLQACLNDGQRSRHELLARFLSRQSLADLFGELHAAAIKIDEAGNTERKALSDAYYRVLNTLIQAGKNKLAETILELEPQSAGEIGEVSDVIMRAFRIEPSHRNRAPLTDALREQLTQKLVHWSERLLGAADCERHTLHQLAEAMAAFPSTFLLEPIRRLLAKDLEIWNNQQQEFRKAMADGKRPDPKSGARMCYTFRYAQNLLSLAQGRDATYVIQDDEEIAPPSPEMTNAVIDILSDYLRDPLFGDEAARVISTLRPDPILSIGTPRRHMSDDIRVVHERRRERQRRRQQAAGTRPHCRKDAECH